MVIRLNRKAKKLMIIEHPELEGKTDIEIVEAYGIKEVVDVYEGYRYMTLKQVRKLKEQIREAEATHDPEDIVADDFSWHLEMYKKLWGG